MNTEPSSHPSSSEQPGRELDDAIQGRYDFSISNIIKEAYEKTAGIKATLLGALGFLVIAMLIASFIIGIIKGVLGIDPESELQRMFVGITEQLFMATISYPLMGGILMLGVRRAVDLPISFDTVFECFIYYVPLAISGILITIFVYTGMFLLIIPGLYLQIAYSLVAPLIVEKNLSFWQAMEISRKAITHHWFKVFFLMLTMGLIVLISALSIIGLIWTIPMTIMVTGILYREVFGVEKRSELVI